MTLAHAHRLHLALNTLARGFAGPDMPPVQVLKTAKAKITVARNLRRLHEVLEPAETVIQNERAQLMTQELAANPESKELTGDRLKTLAKAVQDLNAQECTVNLEHLTLEDLDLDKFVGEEAIKTLAIIDGDVLAG